jgi:DNA-binding LacI/PurR family transcriptional regulator
MPQGPGHRPPTVDDVARAAGVSRQTVSNALNAPARLRPETLQRVLVVVGELGYRPNRAARSLRRRESRLVGLHIRPPQPDQAGSVLDRFLHALAEHSARSGYHVLPFATGDAEEICAFNELLGTTAVDAFVLTDTHRVRRGHRRIGYIGWGEASELGNDRRSGWVTAGRRHGLDNADLEIRSVDRIADGADGASHLMDRDDPPTALVCASDTLAMGALRALDIRGMGPGRDVAVTGFDDTPTAAALPVGLLTPTLVVRGTS